MQIDTAVIPVAGLGTRLLPVSAGVPKEMLPLGRKPALHYIAEELGRAGISRIILVSSHAKEHMAKYFQLDSKLVNRLRDGNKHEIADSLWSSSPHCHIKFDIAIQHEQLGLGHAVLSARKDAGDQPFVVALGDCVLGAGGGSDIVERMVKVSKESKAPIVLAFEQVPDEKVSRFGIATPAAGSTPVPGEDFELAGLIEKPSLADAPSNLAICGRYLLAPSIFHELEYAQRGLNGEYQLTDAINSLIENGTPARGVMLDPSEKRYDVGDFGTFTEAFIEFALADDTLRDHVLKSVGENS
ncbi:MAG: sugar phosphate nucleotidyltransferase [Planctomycetota bacterium]